MKEQFPAWSTPNFTETYLLTSLLHDIGTTPANLSNTQLSFEFHGAIIALHHLQSHSCPTSQAESVTEAIIRHQDLGSTGTLTTIGVLIQLATIFDNMSTHGTKDLVHRETIKDVVQAYPRLKWSSCFGATIRREIDLKPWAHTTHLGEKDFPEGVEENGFMKAYE